MFNHHIHQSLKKFTVILVSVFSFLSLTAQVDYTTIVENRSVVFYNSDETKSLRVDLDNAHDPVLVVYQSYKSTEKPHFDINSFLQSKMATMHLNDMESTIGHIIKHEGSHGTSVTLTDFEGIQQQKMNVAISNPLKTGQGDAGVLRIDPTDTELFIALTSSSGSQVVINVFQFRSVTKEDLSWDESKLKMVYEDCMKTATEEEDSEVCDCIKGKVARQVSFTHYAHLKSQNRQQLVDEVYNACASEYNANRSRSSSETRSKVDNLILLGEQQWKNGEYEAFQSTYEEILRKGRNGDDIYNKLAESYFIQKKYPEFKKSAYMAASTNEFNYFAQAKLIRIALLENDYDRAIKIYNKNKRHRLPNNMKFSKYMKKEIDYMKDLGYVNEQVEKFQNYLEG